MRLAEPRSFHSPALACVAVLALAGGCAPKTTAPKQPMLRAVNVRVIDAGGAPVVNAVVFATGSIGAIAYTDTAGTAHFTFAGGPCAVYTSLPGTGGPAQVAGGTGTVPSNGAPDTVLFRLKLADESVAFGQVLLTNRTDHASTMVGVLDLPIATFTLTDGSWRLDGIPPGDWQGFADHVGFQGAQFAFPVPAPRDTVLFRDPITLVPAPVP